MVARKGFNSKLLTTDVDAVAVLRGLNTLPKEIQNDIRDSNLANSRILAKNIQAAISAADPPQARLIEDSIKPARDRVIRVNAGGPKAAGRPYKSSKSQGRKYRAPAGALVYGSEYGSSGKPQDRRGRNMGARFVRPHNEKGYFIGPAMERFAPQLLKIWTNTIQDAIRDKGFK